MVSGIKKWWIKNRFLFSTVIVGHAAKQVEEIIFDWIIYGAVVGYTLNLYGPVWGSLAGFLIMAPISAVVCYIYLKLYDWAKIDLFGFETLKEVRGELEGDGWWKRLARKLVRLGDVPAFVVLSLNSDPFMTTVYLRKSDAKYRGLSRHDWIIFWSSVLLSNAYWTLRWSVVIAVIVVIFNLLPEPVQLSVTTWWSTILVWIQALF